jgi:hypothetical protein
MYVNVVHFLLCGLRLGNTKNEQVKNKKTNERKNNIKREEETTSTHKWDQDTQY